MTATCAACGLSFEDDDAFDAHRAGSFARRRCLTRAELQVAGWRRLPSGDWTPRRPNRDPALALIAAAAGDGISLVDRRR